jgi:hypothetical protein
MKEMNAGHGPVVAVIQDLWDVHDVRLKGYGFIRPMLVTEDGTMWRRIENAWRPMGNNIIESLGYIENEETTP